VSVVPSAVFEYLNESKDERSPGEYLMSESSEDEESSDEASLGRVVYF
jgi:hypothetical protein